MGSGGDDRRAQPLSWGDIRDFLRQHKLFVIGVITPVVATEVTNVVGPVVRWIVRLALLAIVVFVLALLYIRRRGMWRRSRQRARAFAERFRPVEAETAAKQRARAVDKSTRRRRRPKRRTVVAAASLTLLAAASMAAAVVVSREGGGTPASPVPSSLGPSPTSQTSGSPEQPGTYVDEYIAEVLRELRGAGVTVDLTIKVDPSSRPGVILEQRPDPLPDGAERVAFVVAGRRHATQLDRDFVVAGRGPWSEGPQRIFGRGYGHAFYLRDADCFGDGYCYDYVDRKSPTLALNLGRQFEIVTATLGFDERSVVTERGLVSVVLRVSAPKRGRPCAWPRSDRRSGPYSCASTCPVRSGSRFSSSPGDIGRSRRSGDRPGSGSTRDF